MSKRSGPLESTIVKQIKDKLYEILPGIVLLKRHGTPFGITGHPDLYGCYQGRHIEIEVKRPGEEPTDLQRKRLAEWAAAGAITGCAHSKTEAVELVLRGLNPTVRIVTETNAGECDTLIRQRFIENNTKPAEAEQINDTEQWLP